MYLFNIQYTVDHTTTTSMGSKHSCLDHMSVKYANKQGYNNEAKVIQISCTNNIF